MAKVIKSNLDLDGNIVSGLGDASSSGEALHYGQIGAAVQAYDAKLAAIAGLAVTDGNIIVGNGSTFVAESGATARTSLGLAIGTDVQAYDAELAAIAGLTSASNKIIRFTGSGTAGLLDFVDEDNMASDSATAVASQQSIKAYVDAQISSITPTVNWVADVNNIQTDNTLDPGATPTTGDRYILTDTANLHANFGTITGVGDNDIVQYNGSAFVIATNISDVGEGVFAWNAANNNVYQFNGTAWVNRDTLFTYAGDGSTISISSNTISVASGGVGTTQLAAAAVTYAKIQNVSAQYKLLGRSSAGAGSVEEITTSSFMLTVLDDTDEATFKATVNLEIGTDVQAYDAALDDISGLAVTDGNIIVGDGTNWVAESGATARASLGAVGKYAADFNNTTDWAGSGPFTYTVAAATHGLGATKSLGVFIKSDGTPNLAVDASYSVADNGDVVVTIDSAKFAGDITIIG